MSVFFIAFSVSAQAETVEERKAAANYDETLPAPGEARIAEEVSPTTQVPAGVRPVQAIVPQVPAVPAPGPVTVPAALPIPSGQTVQPAVPPASSVQAGAAQTHGVVQPLSAAPQFTSKDLPEDQVFAASNPSGLVEISGYKYPVFFFAPKDYKTDRTYAMIMIAPAENAKAEQQIEYLTGLAQRRSLFLLAPYVLWPKGGDTPYRLDEWLLEVKRDVMERFPINKKRIYLVGKDLGAHYAAYMAVKYPQEFAAVALLGEAWDGPFSQLIQPRTDAADQVPFYIALKADGEARARNQVWFDKLQEKGYPLHLVEYKSDEELNDLEFKKSVFDWMETTGQNWDASVAQGQKTWKGKFKKGVKNFFEV
ncbi:MAG: hypothetical protein HY767_01905 [Candidatus Omnitrophica bacterium]|nr:hypothetical protein [Candidatus Omnitrophota bacterium]